MRDPCLFNGNTVAGTIQSIHIIDQSVVTDMPFTHFVANNGGRGWDGGVIRDSQRKIVCKGLTLAKTEEGQAEEG